MGTGDPAWAARYGGGGPRSRYTQPPPSLGASVGRVGPRTYMAPSISNQHYGMVTLSFKLLSHLVATGRCWAFNMQGLPFSSSAGQHPALSAGGRMKSPRDFLVPSRFDPIFLSSALQSAAEFSSMRKL